jgi:hypothetical protein
MTSNLLYKSPLKEPLSGLNLDLWHKSIDILVEEINVFNEELNVTAGGFDSFQLLVKECLSNIAILVIGNCDIFPEHRLWQCGQGEILHELTFNSFR